MAVDKKIEEIVTCDYFQCSVILSEKIAVGIDPSGKILLYCDTVCASYARVREQKNLLILPEVPLHQKDYIINKFYPDYGAGNTKNPEKP